MNAVSVLTPELAPASPIAGGTDESGISARLRRLLAAPGGFESTRYPGTWVAVVMSDPAVEPGLQAFLAGHPM